jgi:outer membrane biosynthesis protein TonB
LRQKSASPVNPAFQPADVRAAAAPIWDLPNRVDYTVQINISRNTLIAICFSILLHLLILFLLNPRALLPEGMAGKPQPITVTLNAPVKQAAPEPAIETPPAPPEIERPRPPKSKAPIVKAKPKPDNREVMAVEKPSPDVVQRPQEPVRAPPSEVESTPTDMMSYVNAARAKREAAENYAARINADAAAKERQPTEDELRTAAIKRNLQQSGTNGIFQIISKNNRSAVFAFHGWKRDFSYNRREVVQVDAGPGEDIERLVIRRMIKLIREHEQGYFTWESYRLGRTVTLSAKPEDNAGLEDFLIQEIFGTAQRFPLS